MALSLTVRAVNTAADSENQIHDDRIAAEYGFRGGLVPGVTVYGYMASAAVAHFGPHWLERGAIDVRFFQPFYEGEHVEVNITGESPRIQVEAGSRASATAWIEESTLPGDIPPGHSMPPRAAASRETLRPGRILGTLTRTLDLSQPGMAAPLDAFIGEQRFAHPAIILALANEILVANVILGPWIHSSSEVRNFKPVRDGDIVDVRGKIEQAYERKGHEIVVLDVAILSAGTVLTRVRHTAIWQPRKV
jgi:hypothetical protein